MNSFKMKALAVAVLGLTGLGMAGSAFAVCPTDPAAPAGAWSSKNVSADANLTITTPGLNTTGCKMTVSINAASLANTRALVTDNSPVDEPRYRARFYMDVSGLTGFSLASYQTKIFNASSTTSPAGVSTAEVSLSLLGGTTPAVRFLVADSGQVSNFKIITAVLPAVASNQYRIEIDLTQGATGVFRYWVSDAAVATVDGTPTGTATVNNTGWSGITSVNLGLFSTTAGFRTNMAAKAFAVDEFDSRRQTFIGL